MESRNISWGVMTNPGFKNGYVLPGLDNYDSMWKKMSDVYASLGSRYGDDLIPAGAAWHRVHEDYPEIRLWGDDLIHPVPNASYLFACTIYAYMFNESPEGARYRPKDVSASNAKILQKVAYETVIAYRGRK